MPHGFDRGQKVFDTPIIRISNRELTGTRLP
jgi:hypothetical protein